MGVPVKQALWVGVLIMVGYFAASFLSGIINGVLFTFLPATGAIAAVGVLISLVIFAFILGFLVVLLLAKFA